MVLFCLHYFRLAPGRPFVFFSLCFFVWSPFNLAFFVLGAVGFIVLKSISGQPLVRIPSCYIVYASGNITYMDNELFTKFFIITNKDNYIITMLYYI